MSQADMNPYSCKKHGAVEPYVWIKKNGRAQRRCRSCNGVGAKRFQTDLRTDMLSALGDACACCGETTREFLQFNHINNDGAAHRRVVGLGQLALVAARKDGFPKDKYNILCANCNSLSWRTECPHKRKNFSSIIYDLKRPVRILAA